jgi:hypothetical protein
MGSVTMDRFGSVRNSTTDGAIRGRSSGRGMVATAAVSIAHLVDNAAS